jgi:hypothetical protein
LRSGPLRDASFSARECTFEDYVQRDPDRSAIVAQFGRKQSPRDQLVELAAQNLDPNLS